jgi:hypothetical protein
MSDLRDWLRKNKLEQYADAFEANDTDLDILSELTEHDLEKAWRVAGQSAPSCEGDHGARGRRVRDNAHAGPRA